MAVKIKLKRLGKIRNPQYRIVVADARTKRDGRAIEEIGLYHPKEEPSLIQVNSERVQHWLGNGAQPTEPVLRLLKVTGDWQKFKGEPGAGGTLKTAEPKADKKAAFESAVKESMGDTEAPATAPKAKKRSEPKRSEPKKAEPKKAKGEDSSAKADSGKADSAKADSAKTDSGKESAKTDSAKTDSAEADATTEAKSEG